MSESLTPTEHQGDALLAVEQWLQGGGDQHFVLGGYAGTGKTTILRMLVEEYGAPCAAPTGKAVQVLKEKLPKGSTVRTLHSLLYLPDPPDPDLVECLRKAHERDPDNRELLDEYLYEKERLEKNDIRWLDRDWNGARFVIVDEASMVAEKVESDLRARCHRILFVGDPAQLPPVKSADFFDRNPPDFVLTEVHRQALDSPILRLSMALRQREKFSDWTEDCARLPRSAVAGLLLDADQVITGTNANRHRLNKLSRASLGRTGKYPREGDRLICLRNNWAEGIVNGGFADAKGHAEAVDLDRLQVQMAYEDLFDKPVLVHRDYFDKCYGEKGRPVAELSRVSAEHFDYGYAITCHKSQGSEWPFVVIDDDGMWRNRPDERRRWAYTAVTRARERLVWAG